MGVGNEDNKTSDKQQRGPKSIQPPAWNCELVIVGGLKNWNRLVETMEKETINVTRAKITKNGIKIYVKNLVDKL